MNDNIEITPAAPQSGCRRPGGMPLTERGLRYAKIVAGMRVLDVGCGDGTTVRHLRALGVDAIGVDLAPHNPDGEAFIMRADAVALPFERGEFDAVLFECSLSEMDDAIEALREAERVVKPLGILMMSDIFAKKQAPGMPWITDDIRKILKWAGFGIVFSEDHTAALVTYAAEQIESGATDCFHGVPAQQLGYCLVVAEKYR